MTEKPPQNPKLEDYVPNGLKALFMDTCDAPISVYAEMLWPSLFDLFINLFPFQPSDIIVQTFRMTATPAGKRSRRHMRGGHKSGKKSWRERAGKILDWDPNEEVGKEIGKWSKAGKDLSGTKAALWIIEGLGERLLFYVFLAGVLNDFLYSWITMVNQTEYCHQKDDGVLIVHAEEGRIAAISGWVAVEMNVIDKVRGALEWHIAAGSCAYDNFHVGFGMRARQYFPGVQGVSYKVRITIYRQGSTFSKEWNQTIPSLGYDHFFEEIPAFGPANFQVEVKVAAGGVLMTRPTLTAWYSESRKALPGPTWEKQ